MARWRESYGRPSHIFNVLAGNGNFLDAAATAWLSLLPKESHLPRWVKECVVVITCSTQSTLYCVQGHSHAIRREGVSEERVRAIQNREFDIFDEKERAIFTFAHKAAGAPKFMTKEDYASLHAIGLDDETILEILSIVWVNTAMNMIVYALDVKRTPEQMKELEVF
jgi:uncharacterized peroxidase-related enzyme